MYTQGQQRNDKNLYIPITVEEALICMETEGSTTDRLATLHLLKDLETTPSTSASSVNTDLRDENEDFTMTEEIHDVKVYGIFKKQWLDNK